MSQDICGRCGINQAVAGNSDGGVCLECLKANGPRQADPLIQLRRSELEGMLRDVWQKSRSRAFAEYTDDAGVRYYDNENQAVATALSALKEPKP